MIPSVSDCRNGIKKFWLVVCNLMILNGSEKAKGHLTIFVPVILIKTQSQSHEFWKRI